MCFTVILQSPSHPTAASGAWAYGVEEVPSIGWQRVQATPCLGQLAWWCQPHPTPPLWCVPSREAGGPWEIVCKIVSPLIPKPLTWSDSAFASSCQAAYCSVWLLNAFSPLLLPASLIAPQSDQTEPPACEHSLYFSAIP